MLKLGCDNEQFENEFRTLTEFNGVGAIKVLNKDLIHHALLLQKADPGFTLKTLHQNDFVKSLASYPKPKLDYSHAKTWCEDVHQIPSGTIKSAYLNRAKN